jgi:signal transduction histidine kinase
VLWDDSDWPTLFAGMTAVALVFPAGRLLSPRWRWLGVAAVASFAGVLAAALLDPARFQAPYGAVKSPLPSVGLGWFEAALFLGLFASLIATAVAVVVRLRRADGVERRQMLWLAYAACLIPLGLLVCVVEAAVTGSSDHVTLALILSTQIAIPVCVGIAILRHRLYEIDRLVNQTIVYVALTAVLAAAYIALTLLLGVLAGRGSAWTTAGATLAVALAFRPLRARVQGAVDWRFNRARYEGLRAVERFLADVRSGSDVPERIGEVLRRALRDDSAQLFFWLPESRIHVDAAGRPASVDRTAPGQVQTTVERRGARLGVLVHDAALLDRADLLRGVLVAAGLAIEMARLRVEVRLQLGEVQASRARIVEAGYAERRRLERDLHDGAQQRLVALGVGLRRLQRSADLDGRLTRTLDESVEEIGLVIAELRGIARGLRPARLDEGLRPALRDLARTTPLEVDVDVAEERLAPAVEAAAYFVACEAITNAVKHARASRVAVSAVRRDESLFVSVADDGIGGARPAPGSGLTGLADRLAAQGGSLRVESPHGAGTRLEAEIPCGS